MATRLRISSNQGELFNQEIDEVFTVGEDIFVTIYGESEANQYRNVYLRLNYVQPTEKQISGGYIFDMIAPSEDYSFKIVSVSF